MDALASVIGFFSWFGISHYFNLLFVGFMIRSGIEILSAHPKLYFDDASQPGTEWLRFTRKQMPSDRLWTGADEEESFSLWIALPGHGNLGIGRHWHFLCALFWVFNGFVYITGLIYTGEWRRLIPTSWEIFSQAAQTARFYLHFQLPPHGNPYNALQQLAYAVVVFLLSPFIIASGAAMSPAIAARFPKYLALFGGKQSARSLHFLSLIAMVLFIVGHIFFVVVDDFAGNMAWIVHGARSSESLSVALGLLGLAFVAILHVGATKWSLKRPAQVQYTLGLVIEPVKRFLFHSLASKQNYSRSDITPFFRVNGKPPETSEYLRLAASNFENWRLHVHGMVEQPLHLSLADLRGMPARIQITKHHCIQGWSGVAEWKGVSLPDLLARCRPLDSARYLVFVAFDEPSPGKKYYESVDLELLKHSQAVLAYEMNGAVLPLEHGAPCRLRVETQRGFKMVKYLHSIEVTDDYRHFGKGQGGYREDSQYYGPEAGI